MEARIRRLPKDVIGRIRWVAILLCAISWAPWPLQAHPAQNVGGAGPDGASSDPGFLFQSPSVSLGVRTGLFLHRGDSDLYEFSRDRFTVDRLDYRGLSIGVEAVAWVGERTGLTLDLDGSRLTLPSEYREYLEDGHPIRQTTRLRRGPALALGVRRYLMPRGDQLGEFIWIPRNWNVFLGAGAGLTGYRFELAGDFVDEETDIISTATFRSTGHALFPFLGAGLEVRVTSRLAAMVEGRYLWGSGELGRDFASFAEPLDLSGMRLTAGLAYHF